jgi:hypothetical protein
LLPDGSNRVGQENLTIVRWNDDADQWSGH